jgi:hypothetical protein
MAVSAGRERGERGKPGKGGGWAGVRRAGWAARVRKERGEGEGKTGLGQKAKWAARLGGKEGEREREKRERIFETKEKQTNLNLFETMSFGIHIHKITLMCKF